MRILVADDHLDSVEMLSYSLRQWNFEVIAALDGESAWVKVNEQLPSIVVLDWTMPQPDGLELCRRIRKNPALAHMYVILLSGRTSGQDLVTGLEAGADDYLMKPVAPNELRARVNVGVRTVSLQQKLSDQVADLQSALANVHQLHGLLPICSYCKRIRSDNDYWEQIDTYIAQHSDAQFSHGICPECMDLATSA